MIPSAPAHSILPRLLLGAARGLPAAPATPVARGLVALVAFRSPFAEARSCAFRIETEGIVNDQDDDESGVVIDR